MPFPVKSTGDIVEAEDVNEIHKAWEGVANKGVPFSATAVDDAANYAVDVRNVDPTNSLGLRVRNNDNEEVFAVVKDAARLGKNLSCTDGNEPAGNVLIDGVDISLHDHSGGILGPQLSPSAFGAAAFGSVSLENLLDNGDFELWGLGTAKAPSYWTASGSPTVAQDTGKINSFACKITRGATASSMYQRLLRYLHLAGRKVGMGAWVKTATATFVRLYIDDGVTKTYGDYHTGGNAWEWLAVSVAAGAEPTKLEFGFDVADKAGNAIVDGAVAVQGELIPAFTARPHEPRYGDDLLLRSAPEHNLLRNGGLEFWSAGDDAAPDHWVYDEAVPGGEAAETITKSTTKSGGSFAAALTCTAGKGNSLSQAVANFADYKGKRLTLAVDVYSTVANRGRAFITDGVNICYTPYGSGGSAYERLFCTIDVSATAAALTVYLGTDIVTVGTATTVIFDNATLTLGDGPAPFTPNTERDLVGQGNQLMGVGASNRTQPVYTLFATGGPYTGVTHGIRTYTIPWPHAFTACLCAVASIRKPSQGETDGANYVEDGGCVKSWNKDGITVNIHSSDTAEFYIDAIGVGY